MTSSVANLVRVLARHEERILNQWVEQQVKAGRPGRMSQSELRDQARQFLKLFARAAEAGPSGDIQGPSWAETRDFLGDVSRSRAASGYSYTETATFIFALKQPLFGALRDEVGDGPALASEMWAMDMLLDNLGLYTTEVYQRSREEIIARQSQELQELSTPVVQLWDRILALPLIGTLDSSRTQVVMESLLQRIVETGSSIAIIDITGVPTVDTLVAQHLLKTVAAARLMGADCIISGIRPQTAQTIVHLGVDLSDVVTKASLADAFSLALRRVGQSLNVRPAAD